MHLKYKSKFKSILMSMLSLLITAMAVLNGGTMTAYAESDPAPFAPKDGEYIYSVEPFDAEHSAGYFCIRNSEGHNLRYGVYNEEKNKSGWFFENTEKDEDIYIDHLKGACFNGKYYDIREYVWQTGAEWAVIRNDGSNEMNGTPDDQIHREFHFYEEGTLNSDNPVEVSFKGVMRLTDMDINEGYSFHTGLYGVWLNDLTHITKRDDVTWKGTWENRNDNVNWERETMWVEVEGSPEEPLTITYWGNGGHGSGINYYGNTIEYKLLKNNLNDLPEGAKPAVGVHCATYAEYDLMPAEEFLRYEFSGWYYDKELKERVPESIMVSQDYTFYGTYIKVAGLIETEVVNGEITPTDECVPYGDDKLIEYTANEGYLLESVTVDGETVDIAGYSDSYVFENVQDDHYIKAVYVEPSAEKNVFIRNGEFIDLYKDGEEIDGKVLKEGDSVDYVISYENPTGTQREVVITDKVPEGMGIIKGSISDDGEISDTSIIWTLTVPAYTKDSVSFAAKVMDSAKGSIVTNAAEVTYKAISENEKDVTKTDTVNTPVLDDPIKSVANTNGEDITAFVVNEGSKITYRITFTNPSDEEKIFSVTDEIPEEVELISDSISDSGTIEGNIVSWQMALYGKERKTVSFDVKINDATNKTIFNQAKVKVDNTSKDTITPVPDTPEDPRTPIYTLEDPVKEILNTEGKVISADGNGNSLQTVKAAGDKIIYRISFKNPASITKTFSVKDELPAGVKFVDASGDYTYDEKDHVIYWNAELEGKQTSYVTVMVEILKSAEDTIVQNRANVSVDDASKDTNIVETPVIPTPVKDAVNEDGISINTFPVQIGESFFYTVSFKNPADVVKTAVITDKLPEGVSFVSSSDEGKYSENEHSVVWNILLNAHSEGTVTVKVKVNQEAFNSELKNQAVVGMDEASITTITHNGSEDDETTTNLVSSKIVVNDKDHDIDRHIVSVGDVVTYKIPYQNRSENSRSIMITDILPQGVLYMSASDGGNVQSIVHGQTVIWVFEAEPKSEGYVWVNVKVADRLKGMSFSNSAMIEVKDTVTGQEKKTVTNQVTNFVLDDIVKQVLSSNGRKDLEDEKVKGGTQLLYRITVSNPSTETKIFKVSDEIPEGAEFVSVNDEGSFNKDAGIVSWELSLEGGTVKTVSFVVKVAKNTECTFVQNTASVKVDETTADSNTVKVYVKGNEKKEETKPSETDKPADTKLTETNKPADNKPSDTAKPSDTNTGKGKADAPKTGDESNLKLWACIAGAAVLIALGTGGVLIAGKRKEEE